MVYNMCMKRTHLFIDEEDLQELREIAKHIDRTIGWIIRKAIALWIKTFREEGKGSDE